MLLIYDQCWASIRLDGVLHDRVPVCQQSDLLIVEQVPLLHVRAQARLHSHHREVVVPSVEDQRLELVDSHVVLRAIHHAQFIHIWHEKEWWQRCHDCQTVR